MKKIIFALATAVAVGFTAAVGLCVQTLASPTTVAAFEESMRVVLDAGHGGIDGGVVGVTTKIKESDLNLAITYKLKSELEDLGFEVILTRKTEAGLYDAATKGFKRRDMEKRREIIREQTPGMVLSIHQNFYSSRSARGGQVFYNAENEESEALALALQEKLNALYEGQDVRERKAASGEFFMLECADCPSVIVECGFLSNAKDEALLVDESWQKQLAQVLSAGVLAYFSHSTA